MGSLSQSIPMRAAAYTEALRLERGQSIGTRRAEGRGICVGQVRRVWILSVIGNN